MNLLSEVLITSSTNCSVYDAEKGSKVAVYPGGNFTPKTLAMIASDFVIGAVQNKPLLKVWRLNARNDCCEFPCSGVVNALAVSSCGKYCIAGIKQGVHIWEIDSGELVNVITRHYQDVTCLRFSSDDTYFLSGGKDGHVLVWNLSQAIAIDAEHGEVKPWYVWNHHASEITDIYSGSIASRVATTSLDMTCKIYELDSGLLLSSICMDVPLTAVVLDTLEYYVFLADQRGYIYKINTYEWLPKELHVNEMNSVSFKAHEQKIICLCLSNDGTKILSAAEDNTCKMWDINSTSCLAKFLQDGNVTNAFLASYPALTPDREPKMKVKAFHRNFDASLRNNKVCESKISSKTLHLTHDASPDQFYSEDIIHGPVRTAKEEPQISVYENLFQESIHGNSVNELRQVNNQMYSYMLNLGFEKLEDDL